MPSNLNGKLIDAAPMNTLKLSDALFTGDVNRGNVHIVWTGASHTDAVLKIQESVDGTNWEDIASMTHTLSTAAGAKLLRLGDLDSPYLRANYAKGSNTTGTVTCFYYVKTLK
jgi:hypothetical protein